MGDSPSKSGAGQWRLVVIEMEKYNVATSIVGLVRIVSSNG